MHWPNESPNRREVARGRRYKANMIPGMPLAEDACCYQNGKRGNKPVQQEWIHE